MWCCAQLSGRLSTRAFLSAGSRSEQRAVQEHTLCASLALPACSPHSAQRLSPPTVASPAPAPWFTLLRCAVRHVRPVVCCCNPPLIPQPLTLLPPPLLLSLLLSTHMRLSLRSLLLTAVCALALLCATPVEAERDFYKVSGPCSSEAGSAIVAIGHE